MTSTLPTEDLPAGGRDRRGAAARRGDLPVRRRGDAGDRHARAQPCAGPPRPRRLGGRLRLCRPRRRHADDADDRQPRRLDREDLHRDRVHAAGRGGRRRPLRPGRRAHARAARRQPARRAPSRSTTCSPSAAASCATRSRAGSRRSTRRATSTRSCAPTCGASTAAARRAGRRRCGRDTSTPASATRSSRACSSRSAPAGSSLAEWIARRILGSARARLDGPAGDRRRRPRRAGAARARDRRLRALRAGLRSLTADVHRRLRWLRAVHDPGDQARCCSRSRAAASWTGSACSRPRRFATCSRRRAPRARPSGRSATSRSAASASNSATSAGPTTTSAGSVPTAWGWWHHARCYPALDLALVVFTNKWDMQGWMNPDGRCAGALLADYAAGVLGRRQAAPERPPRSWAWRYSYAVGLLMGERIAGLLGMPERLDAATIDWMAEDSRVLSEAGDDPWDPDGFPRRSARHRGAGRAPEGPAGLPRLRPPPGRARGAETALAAARQPRSLADPDGLLRVGARRGRADRALTSMEQQAVAAPASAYALPAAFVQEWFFGPPAALAVGLPGRRLVAAARSARRTVDPSSLARLVANHEALRSSLGSGEGAIGQLVWPAAPLPLEHRAAVEDLAGACRVRLRRPFDVGRERLARATLFDCGPQERLLQLVVHHAVSDGLSSAVLRAGVRARAARRAGADAAARSRRRSSSATTPPGSASASSPLDPLWRAPARRRRARRRPIPRRRAWRPQDGFAATGHPIPDCPPRQAEGARRGRARWARAAGRGADRCGRRRGPRWRPPSVGRRHALQPRRPSACPHGWIPGDAAAVGGRPRLVDLFS